MRNFNSSLVPWIGIILLSTAWLVSHAHPDGKGYSNPGHLIERRETTKDDFANIEPDQLAILNDDLSAKRHVSTGNFGTIETRNSRDTSSIGEDSNEEHNNSDVDLKMLDDLPETLEQTIEEDKNSDVPDDNNNIMDCVTRITNALYSSAFWNSIAQRLSQSALPDAFRSFIGLPPTDVLQIGDNAEREKRQSTWEAVPAGATTTGVNQIIQQFLPATATSAERQEVFTCVNDATTELQNLLNQFNTAYGNLREGFTVGPLTNCQGSAPCQTPGFMQSAPILIQSLVENPEQISHIPEILQSSIPSSQMSESVDKLGGSLRKVFGVLQRINAESEDSECQDDDEADSKKKKFDKLNKGIDGWSKKSKKKSRKFRNRNNNQNCNKNRPNTVILTLPSPKCNTPASPASPPIVAPVPYVAPTSYVASPSYVAPAPVVAPTQYIAPTPVITQTQAQTQAVAPITYAPLVSQPQTQAITPVQYTVPTPVIAQNQVPIQAPVTYAAPATTLTQSQSQAQTIVPTTYAAPQQSISQTQAQTQAVAPTSYGAPAITQSQVQNQAINSAPYAGQGSTVTQTQAQTQSISSTPYATQYAPQEVSPSPYATQYTPQAAVPSPYAAPPSYTTSPSSYVAHAPTISQSQSQTQSISPATYGAPAPALTQTQAQTQSVTPNGYAAQTPSISQSQVQSQSIAPTNYGTSGPVMYQSQAQSQAVEAGFYGAPNSQIESQAQMQTYNSGPTISQAQTQTQTSATPAYSDYSTDPNYSNYPITSTPSSGPSYPTYSSYPYYPNYPSSYNSAPQYSEYPTYTEVSPVNYANNIRISPPSRPTSSITLTPAISQPGVSVITTQVTETAPCPKILQAPFSQNPVSSMPIIPVMTFPIINTPRSSGSHKHQSKSKVSFEKSHKSQSHQESKPCSENHPPPASPPPPPELPPPPTVIVKQYITQPQTTPVRYVPPVRTPCPYHTSISTPHYTSTAPVVPVVTQCDCVQQPQQHEQPCPYAHHHETEQSKNHESKGKNKFGKHISRRQVTPETYGSDCTSYSESSQIYNNDLSRSGLQVLQINVPPQAQVSQVTTTNAAQSSVPCAAPVPVGQTTSVTLSTPSNAGHPFSKVAVSSTGSLYSSIDERFGSSRPTGSDTVISSTSSTSSKYTPNGYSNKLNGYSLHHNQNGYYNIPSQNSYSSGPGLNSYSTTSSASDCFSTSQNGYSNTFQNGYSNTPSQSGYSNTEYSNSHLQNRYPNAFSQDRYPHDSTNDRYPNIALYDRYNTLSLNEFSSNSPQDRRPVSQQNTYVNTQQSSYSDLSSPQTKYPIGQIPNNYPETSYTQTSYIKDTSKTEYSSHDDYSNIPLTDSSQNEYPDNQNVPLDLPNSSTNTKVNNFHNIPDDEDYDIYEIPSRSNSPLNANQESEEEPNNDETPSSGFGSPTVVINKYEPVAVLTSAETPRSHEQLQLSKLGSAASTIGDAFSGVSYFIAAEAPEGNVPLNSISSTASVLGDLINGATVLLTDDLQQKSPVEQIDTTASVVADTISGASKLVVTDLAINQAPIEKIGNRVVDTINEASSIIASESRDESPIEAIGNTASIIIDALSGSGSVINPESPEESPLDTLSNTAAVVVDALSGASSFMNTNSPDRDASLDALGNAASVVVDALSRVSQSSPNQPCDGRRDPLDVMSDAASTIADAVVAGASLLNSHLQQRQQLAGNQPDFLIPANAVSSTAAVSSAVADSVGSVTSSITSQIPQYNANAAEIVIPATTVLANSITSAATQSDPESPASILANSVSSMVNSAANVANTFSSALSQLTSQNVQKPELLVKPNPLLPSTVLPLPGLANTVLQIPGLPGSPISALPISPIPGLPSTGLPIPGLPGTGLPIPGLSSSGLPIPGLPSSVVPSSVAPTVNFIASQPSLISSSSGGLPQLLSPGTSGLSSLLSGPPVLTPPPVPSHGSQNVYVYRSSNPSEPQRNSQISFTLPRDRILAALNGGSILPGDTITITLNPQTSLIGKVTDFASPISFGIIRKNNYEYSPQGNQLWSISSSDCKDRELQTLLQQIAKSVCL